MKTESMSVKTAMVCLLVVLITSCSEKKEQAFPAPLAPVGTEHWVYNEEISDVMDKIYTRDLYLRD